MTDLSTMSLFSTYLVGALISFALSLDDCDPWQALLMAVLWPVFGVAVAGMIVCGLAVLVYDKIAAALNGGGDG